MNEIKKLERKRDKLRKEYKYEMKMLRYEWIKMMNKFKLREKKMHAYFESNIELVTQQIISEYKFNEESSVGYDEITTMNRYHRNESKYIPNDDEITSLYSDSISTNIHQNVNMDVNIRQNANIRNRNIQQNANIPNRNGQQNVYIPQNPRNSNNTQLIEMKDESKYKSIVMTYCAQNNLKYPIETVKRINGDTHKAQISFELTDKKVICVGYASKKKDAIYDGYYKLIPNIMNIQEANKLLSRFLNNYKKQLIDFALKIKVRPPLVNFDVFYDTHTGRNIHVANVEFMDKIAEGNGWKKIDAEQHACKNMFEILFPAIYPY